MTLKKVLYAVCILALIFGAWGVVDRLSTGHQNANYGSYVVWGLWVAMYLFFAGTAAGSFMFATLDFLFNIKLFKGTGKAAFGKAKSKRSNIRSGRFRRLKRYPNSPRYLSRCFCDPQT